MYNHYYENACTSTCSAKGTIIHTVSVCETIANKNGVELRQVTITDKTHWELFMDGELLNKFYNLKTAKSMWKDFSC